MHQKMTSTIIAYTYEADVHCIECTQYRFYSTDKTDIDENNISETQLDSENNIVAPVINLPYHEHSEFILNGLVCGDCYNIIVEAEEFDIDM